MLFYHDLLSKLQTKDILLTANKHLSIFLRQEHREYQRQLGRTIWTTPSISPIKAWLRDQWTDALISNQIKDYLLLTSDQEQVLWETIITKKKHAFINLDETTKSARQAWALIQQGRCSLKRHLFKDSKETHIWRQWVGHFMALCQKYRWIDDHTWVTLLTQLLAQQPIFTSKRIFLVGFTYCPPQYCSLFESLRKQGNQVIAIPPKPSGKTKRLAISDVQTELITMAKWAYTLWEQGKKRIACAIPQLQKSHLSVLSCFQDIFLQKFGQFPHSIPVNLNINQPLIRYPLVHGALTALSLHECNPLDKLTYLLRSPYFVHTELEQSQRALLDRHLRNQSELWISLSQLIQVCYHQNCHCLALELTHYQKLHHSTLEKLHPPSYWSDHFSTKLLSLGYPGKLPLNSTEQTVLFSFMKLFKKLASFDPILSVINESTALRQLQSLAETMTLQTKKGLEDLIQILDPSDITGMYFDHLWVMGLTDTWPSPMPLNPFLPLALQKRLGLPSACHEARLLAARQSTDALAQSAHKVIFSYPLQENGLPTKPSPWILQAPSVTLHHIGLEDNSQRIPSMINLPVAWDIIQDNHAPVLNSLEKVATQANLLKQQANCPFQAFTHFRLKVQSCYLPKLGLSAAKRGMLLHRALELLWKTLSNQEKLLACSDEQLTQLTQQAIHQTFSEINKKPSGDPLLYFFDLEKEHLVKLIKEWLELEKKRPPFSVLATEKIIAYPIGRLALSLRVDRIDCLDEGVYLVLDYKSGKITLTDWVEERITEPQLPLYCLSLQPNTQAVAFAQLSSEHKAFKGISAQDTGIHGIQTIHQKKPPQTWKTVLQRWQQNVQTLALSFEQGFALVDPKKGKLTCQYCDLKLFCRIRQSDHYV